MQERLKKTPWVITHTLTLVLLLAACGAMATQQPIKTQTFALTDKGVYPNNGSDVYVADSVPNLVSTDSWHETATLKLPKHLSCPNDGTHRGLGGWIGLYAGSPKSGHFYQAVVANFCQGWYFQLSDLGVANNHAQKPVLIDTTSSPTTIPDGATIELVLDYDGAGGYTATFGTGDQTYSASLSGGIAPNQSEFGMECPKLVSGYVKAPLFDSMSLINMAFNGVRLNQWTVIQYKTRALNETSGLSIVNNSFTVEPAS